MANKLPDHAKHVRVLYAQHNQHFEGSRDVRTPKTPLNIADVS